MSTYANWQALIEINKTYTRTSIELTAAYRATIPGAWGMGHTVRVPLEGGVFEFDRNATLTTFNMVLDRETAQDVWNKTQSLRDAVEQARKERDRLLDLLNAQGVNLSRARQVLLK